MLPGLFYFPLNTKAGDVCVCHGTRETPLWEKINKPIYFFIDFKIQTQFCLWKCDGWRLISPATEMLVQQLRFPSQGYNNIYHYLVLWYPNTGVWVCRLKTRVLQQCHNRGSYMSVMFHSLFGLRTNITPKLYITGLTGPKTVSWIIRMTRGFPSQGSSNYGMRFYINRVPCICSLGLCPSYNICFTWLQCKRGFIICVSNIILISFQYRQHYVGPILQSISSDIERIPLRKLYRLILVFHFVQFPCWYLLWL